MKRADEADVHKAEGAYVPIQLLGELGADARHLHDTIATICAHCNLTPRGAAAHLAHAAAHEIRGGAKIPMHKVIQKGKHLYGERRHCGGLAMGGYDESFDGGFSFSDFMSGAKRAAAKAKEYAKKAVPVAQAVHAAIPQAASVLSALGLNKAAKAATSAHARAQELSDQYGSDVMNIIGSGGLALGGLAIGGAKHHKRGYVRR